MPSEGAVAEDVVPQGDANDNEPPEQAAETLTPPEPEPSEDSNNNPAETLAILPSPVAEASTPEEADTCPSSQLTVSLLIHSLTQSQPCVWIIFSSKPI